MALSDVITKRDLTFDISVCRVSAGSRQLHSRTPLVHRAAHSAALSVIRGRKKEEEKIEEEEGTTTTTTKKYEKKKIIIIIIIILMMMMIVVIAIASKSRATRRALVTCNMPCASWYEETAQLQSLTELII